MSAENIVTKTCPICGSILKAKNAVSGPHPHYCSLTCRGKAKAVRRSLKARALRKPRTCKQCHQDHVWSSNPMCFYCKPCSLFLAKQRQRTYLESHRAAAAEASRKWRKADPERYRETQRRQRHKDLEKYNASKRRYDLTRVEKNRERSRRRNLTESERQRKRKWSANNPQYIKEWRLRNRFRMREYALSRELRLARRSLSKEQRAAIFELRKQARGLGLTIDHIVPLKPCRVCNAVGKHAPENLQLLSLQHNLMKNNRCQTCWDSLRS